MKKLKNTTSNGKKEKSIKTKREKTEYPALNKGMNLSSRKDYIEPDYINGVYDENGKQVIRPLNSEEKSWLNQFYEETTVTNFLHHPDLRKLNRYRRAIIEDDTVKTIQGKIKELKQDKKNNAKRIKELKEIITLTKKQNEETYADQLEYIDEELQELREKYLLYPNKEDHKQFYNQNNSRNNCIFNRSRMTGKLMDLEIEEYDAYVSSMTQGIDMEDVIISEIEQTDWDSQNDKVEAIMKEIVEYFKTKTKS